MEFQIDDDYDSLTTSQRIDQVARARWVAECVKAHVKLNASEQFDYATIITLDADDPRRIAFERIVHDDTR